MKAHQDMAGTVRQLRRSSCMARSHARELARVRRLSVKARIHEAFSMGNHFAELKPVSRGAVP